MFNNVALDVCIGLVFIFLIHSLLVTIIGEMVSTWLGVRARILRIAIERMDGKPESSTESCAFVHEGDVKIEIATVSEKNSWARQACEIEMAFGKR